MRIHFSNLVLWLAIFQMTQSPTVHAQAPQPTMPELLMRSQPTVDISAPVIATASFDPPLVRPGEKSIYRITFNATEVSVQLPEQVPAPSALKFQRHISGQFMEPIGGALRLFSTFNYDVRAMEPGVFTVPEFQAEVYGQPVTVPAAQLEVKAELPEPHEPARQLRIQASVTNVFVGEMFNVSVRLPATGANGVEGVSQIELNSDGFIVDKNTVRQSIQTVEQDGRRVQTYVYETSLTPISAGQLEISAQGFTSGMQFSGPVVITGQISLSGGPPKYLLLESEPVTITVRPLPTENELPGFTGAVGSYTCDPPSLMTNTLKMGEPAQLTVVTRGQQNLGRINPPLPPHAAGWQVFPAVRGALVPGTATRPPGASFKYTLIPLSGETRATPVIPFSCFDPARGQYVDLTIPSVPVTVLADRTLTNAEAALMLSENNSEPEKKTGLSRLASSCGHTAGGLVPWQLRRWFPLVQMLPALGFCGLWFWDRRRRHLERHPEIVRRRQARRALRRELRLLEQAATARDEAGFIRCAVNALQVACAPHYPATPRALVCGDVLQILTAPEREGQPGEIVRRFFAAADATAFAGTAISNPGLPAEKSALKELLAKLEARL
jgi:hypothetical protein